MIKCEEIFKRIDELEKDYINFWLELCRIESPTTYKEGVDRAGNYVVEKAKLRGWKIERQKQEISGDCICITMNKDSKEAPICLSGHLDTVHPVGLFGSDVVTLDTQKIYGPGVSDCKGGIVAAFLAMVALEDKGFDARPIKLILQSDEETSSRESKKTTIEYMCECAKGAKAFLNCEPFLKGTAVIQRKGIAKYTFNVTGKAAHAGNCFDGMSAICEASHKIIEFEKHKDKDGITANCGLISGGTAINTVPEKCSFSVDFRFSNNEELEQVKKIVSEVAKKSYVEGTSCEAKLESLRDAMEFTEKNEELLNKMNEIYKENGLPELSFRKTTGGSDAAYTTKCQIPTIDSIGVECGNIHSKDEYAIIASLCDSAKRIASVCYCL